MHVVKGRDGGCLRLAGQAHGSQALFLGLPLLQRQHLRPGAAAQGPWLAEAARPRDAAGRLVLHRRLAQHVRDHEMLGASGKRAGGKR